MGTTDNSSAAGAVDAIKSKSSGMNSGLSASVGIGGVNLPDDVQTVSSTLHANGLMDAPQSTADNSLFTGITKAQENMDWSLKRDGLVKPGGPTEQRFQHLAGQGFVKRAAPHPHRLED